MSGLSWARPSLGAAHRQRFPFFLGQQQRQGHSLLGGGHHGDHHQDHHEEHHEPRALDSLYSAPPPEPLTGLYSAPPEEEVVPLDGLYGAPLAPPPEEPELPAYAEEVPAPSQPVTVAAPAMMMMDPSYSFQFSNEDSSRSEENDINGVLTGSYSYKTPGGEDIEVRYRAGADTGFVIENMDEVNAAIARSASEAVETVEDSLDSYGAPLAEVKTYSGEEAAIDWTAPGVDASMNLERDYRYGYKSSDQEVSQESDSEGEVSGSYSYTMPDGKQVQVRYTAGKNGFQVENLEDLMETVHEEADLGQYGADQDYEAPAAVVVAKSAAPANDDYSDYEPYVHVDIPAEPYVHQDMPYVHEDIPAEPYVHQEGSSKSSSSSTQQKKAVGRRRVAVKKHQEDTSSGSARSFEFEANGDEHEFTEKSDDAGERVGSYSYISPEGDKITVRYSAGKNGFVILNPEEVLPQPVQ